MEFHSTQKNLLIQFMKDKNRVHSALVYGDLGLGKSKTIEAAVFQLDVVNISFEKEFRPPFDCIIRGLSLSPENRNRETVIKELSRAYKHKDCIIYENFEYCDADSFDLIKQVIQFHEKSGYPAISIIEWNSDCSADCMRHDCLLKVPFYKLQDTDLEAYIKTIIRAKNQKQLSYVCNQLIHIADGNLLALRLAMNILLQKEILTKSSDNKYMYSGDKFQDCLLLLYLDLFETLETHIQESLRLIVPFEDSIHVPLFKDAFDQCKMIDTYLDEISKYQSFLFSKHVSHNNMNVKKYMFTVKEAKAAVMDSTQADYLHQITTQLYQHLENLRKKVAALTDIRKDEHIYILTLLTKIKNHQLTINHLPYFVELMEYYSERSSYKAVILQAEQFLHVNVLSIIQINAEQPKFFRYYFRALLATGQYNTIIQYLDKLPDWDIKLLIAYAYYNNGNPTRALGLCEELELQHPNGEVYSLEASIYDWLGDRKRSVSKYKKALLFVDDNEALKYTLYKKYSMYVDFELPECKSRMEEALCYYQNTSMRQYAETLHNYGTDCILTFSDQGISYLEKAKQLLLSLCENEVYYAINSICIYHCLNENFDKAIKMWEMIDAQHIQIDFCRFAIQNNLFCAYIRNNDLALANNMKEQLTHQLDFLGLTKKTKQIILQRPDIQHQVRQYFLNCALLESAQGNQENTLNYLMSALECSKYPSTMLYLIQKQVEQFQKTNHTTILNVLLNKLRDKKLGSPGKLASFFAQHEMYFCIVMFWGDY